MIELLDRRARCTDPDAAYCDRCHEPVIFWPDDESTGDPNRHGTGWARHWKHVATGQVACALVCDGCGADATIPIERRSADGVAIAAWLCVGCAARFQRYGLRVLSLLESQTVIAASETAAPAQEASYAPRAS